MRRPEVSGSVMESSYSIGAPGILAGIHAAAEPRQRLPVIPGHPVLRPLGELLRVLLQLGQIVEGIAGAELAGVDEAHKEVAHSGAVLGLVEQLSFAMENGLLQRPLAEVVVQRRPSHPQKEGELAPVIFHVGDRCAEAGVGLDLPFR